MITSYNIPVRFSDLNHSKYGRLTQDMNNIFDRFDGVYRLFKLNGSNVFEGDFDLIKSCYRGKDVVIKNKDTFLRADQIRYIVSKKLNKGIGNFDWNVNNIKTYVESYFKIIKRRNDLLNNSVEKHKAALNIFTYFSKNILVLCDSKDYAANLNNDINNIFLDGYHRYVSTYITNDISGVSVYDENTNRPIVFTSGNRKDEPKRYASKGLSTIIKENVAKHKFNIVVTTRVIPKDIVDVEFDIIVRLSSTATLNKISALKGLKGCIVLNFFIDEQTLTKEKDIHRLTAMQKTELIPLDNISFINNIFDILK